MRRFLLLVALCSLCHAAPAATMWNMLASPYGDARLATLRNFTTATNINFEVELTPGRHSGFTVCAWIRTVATRTSYLTTCAFWCADPIEHDNPDLAAGAFGYGSPAGTNLTAAGGSVTVASFPWQPYTDSYLSNSWPRGVYTIAGWSSNAVTVTLGGTDVTLGPGAFERNAIPGPDAAAVVSGTGLASVGISRTPGHRFYGEIDGVADAGGGVAKITAESIVTNELAFCVWRFRIEGTNQIYRSDLGRMAAFNELSQVKTNDVPACGAYDSRGYYRVGLTGIGDGAGDAVDHDIFDGRVMMWWLDDEELDRIHANGVEEIARRGIPQWRSP